MGEKKGKGKNKLVKIILSVTAAVGIGIIPLFYYCPGEVEQIGKVSYHGSSTANVMKRELCFSDIDYYWVVSERGIEYPAEVSKDLKTVYINGEDFEIIQE